MMQRFEDNETGVGKFRDRRKNKKPKWDSKNRQLTSQAVQLLRGGSEAGSIDEDDEASSIDELSNNPCVRAFKNAVTSFIPGWTPVFMYLTLVVVVLLAGFSHASEGHPPDFAFYGIYLAITGLLILMPLLLRVFWIFFFGRGFFILSSRIYTSLAAVLDPEITYLIFAITIAVFWSNALKPIEPLEGDESLIKYTFLNNPNWILKPGDGDRTLLARVEILLIIWASRNVIVSAVMFYFLVGFLMNMNAKLVKFLTIYSLVRKLNANWIRLTPVLNEMTANPAPTSVEEDEVHGFMEYRTNTIQPQQLKQSPVRLRTLSAAQRENLVEAPFQGPESHIFVQCPTPSAKNEALLEEILAVEAQQRRPSRSVQSPTGLGVTLNRLNSASLAKKRKKHLKECYNVEFAGRSLPSVMLRRNIKKTQTDGVANLLAIQYVRSSPVVLFVRGTRVELHSKKLAKLVAKRLFEELIEFRNSVAPGDQELSTQQLDQLVRQSVIQTVETTMQRQASIGISVGTRSPKSSVDLTRHASLAGMAFPLQSISASTDFPTPPNLNGGTHTTAHTEHHPLSQSPDSKTKAATTPEVPVQTQTEPDVKKTTEPHLLETPRETWDASGESTTPYSISILRARTDVSKDSSRPPPSDPEQKKNFEQDVITEAVPPMVSRQDPSHTHEAPTVPAGPAVHFLRQKPKIHEDERKLLTRELFELFMGDQVDEFMVYADPGGRDIVSRREFVRMIVEIYQGRKQLLELVDSQEGIRNVFRRMVSLFLTFISLLIFLGVAGVSVNTLIISGAASLSSFTVAMSFLYSGFIQSVLFVCFLNPYNVGDRVRIEDNMHTVKKISTYFTEFVTSHGKPVFWNHSTLYGMKIVNESRNRNAGLEIPIAVSYDTPPSKYEALHRSVHDFVQNNNDFVKDSCTCVMGDVAIGHFIKFTYWITLTESWHNWRSVWASRGRLMKMIIRQCRDMNITYRLPIQPIYTIGEALRSASLREVDQAKPSPLEFKVSQTPPESIQEESEANSIHHIKKA